VEGWIPVSDVPLREYIEAQIRGLRDHVDHSQKDNHRALELATKSLHERFEQVNQFRAQVLEERAAYARHDFVSALEKRVTNLEIAAANAVGRWTMISLGSSGIGAAIGFLLSWFLKGH
jgi:hypothetical protein